MRKFGIAFLVFAVIGVLFVTLAPFSYSYESQKYDGDTLVSETWFYFNGRTKFSVTLNGETTSMSIGEAIWIEIGIFPVRNIVFIAV